MRIDRRRTQGWKIAALVSVGLGLLAGSLGCAADKPSSNVSGVNSGSGATGVVTSGTSGSLASGSAGNSSIAGSGAGRVTGASGSISGGVSGVGVVAVGGKGGTSVVVGGSSGSAGNPGGASGNTAGASGGAGMMATSYPMLDASAIGTATQVASGFTLAESPLWDPCGHRLLFADVNAAGGGAIDAMTPDGKVSNFMMGTGNTNGMAYDIDGSLILTQMGAHHVVRRDSSGMLTMLDPANSMLHTPDDVVVRSDGTIYFTDGDFCPIGDLLGYNLQLPVYVIKPNSSMLINADMVSGPNGIELSPDEKLLYVDGYGDGTITAFDVATDGSLTRHPTPFETGLGDPDSLCLDAAGNLYVAVDTGIQVIRPDGSMVKLIQVTAPAGSCGKAGLSNCTFGGDDGKTLYITAWTTIWKVDNMPIPGLDWVVSQKRAKCM